MRSSSRPPSPPPPLPPLSSRLVPGGGEFTDRPGSDAAPGPAYHQAALQRCADHGRDGRTPKRWRLCSVAQWRPSEGRPGPWGRTAAAGRRKARKEGQGCSGPLRRPRLRLPGLECRPRPSAGPRKGERPGTQGCEVRPRASKASSGLRQHRPEKRRPCQLWNLYGS